MQLFKRSDANRMDILPYRFHAPEGLRPLFIDGEEEKDALDRLEKNLFRRLEEACKDSRSLLKRINGEKNKEDDSSAKK